MPVGRGDLRGGDARKTRNVKSNFKGHAKIVRS